MILYSYFSRASDIISQNNEIGITSHPYSMGWNWDPPLPSFHFCERRPTDSSFLNNTMDLV